jgi:hypothetical protein
MLFGILHQLTKSIPESSGLENKAAFWSYISRLGNKSLSRLFPCKFREVIAPNKLHYDT